MWRQSSLAGTGGAALFVTEKLNFWSLKLPVKVGTCLGRRGRECLPF